MKRFLTLLLVLCICLTLFPATVFAAEPQIDQLKIAISKTQGPFTPFSGCSSKSWELIGLLYDNLYEMDTHRNLQPSLAKSYTVSDDFTTYTFKLRDDVAWSDGEKFTAEDVKFSYDLAANVVNSVNFTTPSKQIKEMNIPDPYTIEFVLSAPRSEEIIENLFGYMPIIAKHAYQGLTADEIKVADIRVGTGPYTIADMKEDEFYRLKANPNYFGGTPVAKELVLPIIEDKTAAFTALKSGQIDAMMGALTTEIVEQFKNDPNLTVLSGIGYASTLLFMNESRAPFDKKEFRQAISCSIDVDNLVKTLLLGRGTAGSPGFVSPKDKLYNPATPKHVYDVKKANELLDSINYKDVNGDGFRENDKGEALVIDLMGSSSNAVRVRTAEMLKEYIVAVGINVNLKILESGVIDSLVAPNWDGVEDGDYDMTMWGWGDAFMTTPSRYVEQFHSDPKYGPSNLTRIKDPEMDAILNKIRDSISIEKRDEAVDEMQIFLADHTTMVPLYYDDVAYAYNTKAYSGWKLTDGKSYVNKKSLVAFTDAAADNQSSTVAPEKASSEASADANAPADVAAPKANNTGIYVIAAIVIIGIVAFVVYFKKNKKK